VAVVVAGLGAVDVNVVLDAVDALISIVAVVVVVVAVVVVLVVVCCGCLLFVVCWVDSGRGLGRVSPYMR
jgi:hypothetical protein